MPVPFRPQAGDPVPLQQTSTTCGSASLTVARMLIDDDFAEWVRSGARHPGRRGLTRLAGAGTPSQRFAAHEQVVKGRTNALRGAGGRWQLPWPHALGTPPWGGRNELEHGAAETGADYDVVWFRVGGRRRLEQAYAALSARVRPGRPALLYVGDAWLPRHVVLVMPGTGGHEFNVYEPSGGQVIDLAKGTFVERRLDIGGWPVPWAAVWADPLELPT